MIVFDDGGVQWRDDTVAFQQALQTTLGGRVLALYSVVNIGFVAAELSTRAVSIHLRPAVASGVALASLFYWLCSQRVSRVVVRAFDGTNWQHTLVGSHRKWALQSR